MQFVANVNNFIGAMTIGAGFGIGWTLGCWIVGPILRAVKV